MEANQIVTNGFTSESAAKISRLQNEPPWMLERRIQASQIFEQLPLPKTNSENWRRTDIRGLNLKQFQLVTSNRPQPNGKHSELFPGINEEQKDSGLIVQKDATVVYSALSDTLTNRGVYFSGFKTALDERPDPDDSKAKGCGCTIGAQRTIPWWALALLVGWSRRHNQT